LANILFDWHSLFFGVGGKLVHMFLLLSFVVFLST